MKRLVLATGLAAFILPAWSISLLEAVSLAEKNDPQYLAQQETHKTKESDVTIASAVFFPSLTASAGTKYTHDDPVSPQHFSVDTVRLRYNESMYGIHAEQTLFDWSDWKKYSQARKRLEQSKWLQQAQKQALLARAANAYINILEAHDQHQAANNNEQALLSKLSQTKTQVEAGKRAQTDAETANAAYQTAHADTIVKKNTLTKAYEKLAEIIGKQTLFVAKLSDDFEAASPEPADPNAWVGLAYKHSLSLRQKELAVIDRDLGISIAKGAFSPKLTANFDYQDGTTHQHKFNRMTNPPTPTSELKIRSKKYALDATVNLFNGGASYGGVTKARHLKDSAMAELEQAKRKLSSTVRQDYIAILAKTHEIHAQQAAVKSADLSLAATDAAYEAGSRTLVDVLHERNQLYKAQSHLAKAKYDYIKQYVKLKQDVGLLAQADIEAIQAWLVAEEG